MKKNRQEIVDIRMDAGELFLIRMRRNRRKSLFV